MTNIVEKDVLVGSHTIHMLAFVSFCVFVNTVIGFFHYIKLRFEKEDFLTLGKSFCPTQSFMYNNQLLKFRTGPFRSY